ncbi:MAG: hypothetical protein MJZ38_06985 [archaeon]|nr:hypothetical protein [archaeon]
MHMFRNDNTREGADLRRLLLAVTAVAVMVLAAFAMVSSDSSDADPAVDGKTFYYSQLTESQKAIYDKFCTMTFENPRIVTTYPGITTQGQADSLFNQYIDDENVAFDAFKNEHIEMFWVSNGHSSQSSFDADTMLITTTVSISNQWGNNNAEINNTISNINTVVNAIDSEIDKTNRDTLVQSIHNQLAARLQYLFFDEDHPIPSGNEPRNIATAFLDSENIVCEGFAKAFKYLCDKYGVPCILVSGWAYSNPTDRADNFEEDSNRHMWNMVQLESGKWYLVDLTWNDSHAPMTAGNILMGSGSKIYSALTIAEDHNICGDVTRQDHTVIMTFTTPTLSTTDHSADTAVIVFKDWDDHEISRATYAPGDTIVVPANPSRDPTNTEIFTFKCWIDLYDDSEVSSFDPVTGDKFFKAEYHPEPRKYTVVFKDSADRGSTVLQSLEYLYDAPLTTPADPADSKDDYFCYTFLQWSPAVPATVTAEMEIVAQYQKVKNFTEDSGNLLVKSRGDNISFNAADITIIQGFTGTLTVVMPDATIVFDNTAAKALSAEETLSVDIRDFKTLSKEARDIIGNAVVYEIDFGTNSNAFSAGKATVSLKFTPSAEQDKDNLKLFHVAGTTSTEVPCTYADGMLTFETTHFSTYAIQIPEEKNLDIIGMLMENYVLIAILLFAFLGMAISYKMS